MNNQIKTLCETIFNKLVYLDKKYPDVMELTQYTDFSDCVLSSDLCLANMYFTDIHIDKNIYKDIDTERGLHYIINYMTNLLINSKNERIYFETIYNINLKTEYIKNILEYQIQFIQNWNPYVLHTKNNN